MGYLQCATGDIGEPLLNPSAVVFDGEVHISSVACGCDGAAMLAVFLPVY